MSMMCTAILAALDDAGLAVTDLDGFAIYSSACDPALVGSVLMWSMCRECSLSWQYTQSNSQLLPSGGLKS